MYLLYIDESGNDSAENFVLCGVAVFERRIFFLAKDLNDLVSQILPKETEYVELHASVMRAQKTPPWDRFTQKEMREFLDKFYNKLSEQEFTLFASIIHRESFEWFIERQMNTHSIDPTLEALFQKSPNGKISNLEEIIYISAFEQLVSRFDMFLDRVSFERDEQRGMILMAYSEMQERLESIAKQMQQRGTRWREMRKLGEFMPWFSLSRNSRILQIADACANAIYGYYEGGHSLQFNKLFSKFDNDRGRIHGIHHFAKRSSACPCPGCVSRKEYDDRSSRLNQ